MGNCKSCGCNEKGEVSTYELNTYISNTQIQRSQNINSDSQTVTLILIWSRRKKKCSQFRKRKLTIETCLSSRNT